MTMIPCPKCGQHLMRDSERSCGECRAVSGGKIGFWDKCISAIHSVFSRKNQPQPFGTQAVENDSLATMQDFEVKNTVASRPKNGEKKQKHSADHRSSSTAYTVPSFTEPGVSYSVILNDMTCTCPDWEKRRRNFPKNDIRRMCKHLVCTWSKVGAQSLGEFSGIVGRYATLGWGIPLDKKPVSVNNDVCAIATLEPPRGAEGQWYDISLNGDHYAYS